MKSQILISSLVLLFSSSAFAGDHCAAVSVVPGNSCGNLGVKLDLSACNDGGGEVKIKCLDDRNAEATLITEKAHYSVHLTAADSWGQKTWIADKGVVVVETAPQPKVAVVAEKKHKSSRSPAALMTTKKGAIPGQPAPTPKPHFVIQPAPEAKPEAKKEEAKPTETKAAETKPAEPTPQASPTPESALSGLSFSGFFDMYAGHNFNSPQPAAQTPPNLQLSQNQLRAFDLYSNSFALNLAELSIVKKGKEVSLHIDLDFGQQADAAAGGTSATAADSASKNIGQAFVTWNPTNLPNLTVNAGKMYTFLGFETPKSKDNWNYSRSLLFTFALPVWHTGANAAYAVVPDVLTLAAHIYNGWNTLYSSNSGKTYGLQAAYTPNKEITINANVLTGPQQVDDTSDYKTIYEGTVLWTISPKWSWAVDGVAGHSSNDINAGIANNVTGGLTGNFQSVETLAKYSVSETSYFSPRLEYFWDPKGVGTEVDQDIWEGTLTFGHTLTEGLEGRVEGRFDHSNADSFIGSNGNSDHQTTLEFALLYSF